MMSPRSSKRKISDVSSFEFPSDSSDSQSVSNGKIQTWQVNKNFSQLYHDFNCNGIAKVINVKDTLSIIRNKDIATKMSSALVTDYSSTVKSIGLTIDDSRNSKPSITRMLYRLRAVVKSEFKNEDPSHGFGCVEDFLNEFKLLNPGSIAKVECENVIINDQTMKRFHRALLVPGQIATVKLNCEIKLSRFYKT